MDATNRLILIPSIITTNRANYSLQCPSYRTVLGLASTLLAYNGGTIEGQVWLYRVYDILGLDQR